MELGRLSSPCGRRSMRWLIEQAFAPLSSIPVMPIRAKANPKSPVRATAATTKLKFIVNFAETGNRQGVLINKILPNRYPRQAKKGAQENMEKIQARKNSKSHERMSVSLWTAQKNTSCTGRAKFETEVVQQTKLRLVASDQFSVGAHPPTVAQRRHAVLFLFLSLGTHLRSHWRPVQGDHARLISFIGWLAVPQLEPTA